VCRKQRIFIASPPSDTLLLTVAHRSELIDQPAMNRTRRKTSGKDVIMKRSALYLGVVLVFSCFALGQEAQPQQAAPWTGKYPMSFFTKTRTANTVGKGRLSVAIKLQSVNCDEMIQAGCHEDLSDTDKFDQFKSVLTMKYGWAKDHHIALGIPYIWTDFESSSKDIDSDGIGNVFVFNKCKFVKETKLCPAVAFDVWYYFDSGDSSKKLGSSDDSVKLAVQVSKAWKTFSLHLNPAYRWNLDQGCDIGEVNLGGYYNLKKNCKLGMEYNFTDKKEKGECHDLVPGILWKPDKNSSMKLGAVVNLDSDMKYKDDLGAVAKMFYKF
jgi:hypothetical protein